MVVHMYVCFSFSVDGTPIREFKNMESKGVAFPKEQPMRIYSSLWNADDWATRGGIVKTDWSQAPFTASYRNFNANACVHSGASSCTSNSASSNAWFNQQLDSTSQDRLSWVQKNYMIYNYCTDTNRFPQGLPPECQASWLNWFSFVWMFILLFFDTCKLVYLETFTLNLHHDCITRNGKKPH